MYETRMIIYATFLGLIFSAPLWLLFFNTASVTIERPYLNEYNQCESKLSECVASKTPLCAPCKCEQSNGYWFFYILGVLVYIATLAFGSYKTRKLEAKEKELDDMKKELEAKKSTQAPKKYGSANVGLKKY